MKSSAQTAFVQYLRSNFVGPRGDENEVLDSNPVYSYLSGMLFPVEDGEGLAPESLDEDLSPDQAGLPGEADPRFPGEDDNEQDDIGNLTSASGWTPSSLGMSFVHDAAELIVTARAARYERLQHSSEQQAIPVDSQREGSWQRINLGEQSVVIARDTDGEADLWHGQARLQWRSRPGREHPIVTIALSNAAHVPLGRAKKAVESVLFQCGFEVESVNGQFQPYPGDIVVNSTPEDIELDYRYRSHLSYAVGHGVAATWDDAKPVVNLATDPIPTETVRPVRARAGNDAVLSMQWLADESVTDGELCASLLAFIGEYEGWVFDRQAEALTAPAHHSVAAISIVARMSRAVERMRDAVQLLSKDKPLMQAFRLANRAMRVQSTRTLEAASGENPAWRPFQLAFILLTLASTTGETHEDRELVDLIWFPTGGGKTEAYLGLAAIEIIHRRLTRGYNGGGTSVLTRYTMRLLTAQQFQRAARLICALELLRRTETSLGKVPQFSIGLLLGNSTTPGNYKQAVKQLADVRGQQSPQNPFQVRTCPWCDTVLLPARKSARDDRYGFRATASSFTIFCINPECPFHDELPMQVVDEAIYEKPPTVVVATVDKFARLAWIPGGSSIFGLGGVPFDPPSLIIQDELHLISGPLGTIVGIYEAAIHSLLRWRGTSPKIVASTATIRSATEQVRGLMAAPVEVFPPSGLDADDSYFAQLDTESSGRIYVGLMPQAFAPAWSIGQVAGRMLQAPQSIELTAMERDAYWTLLVYHNSLRELGRTVTILRDDVRTLLDREAHSQPGRRTMGSDGIQELTSNVSSHELVEILERLEKPVGDPGVIDALAATNILSVGIDVARLGLMMVNGQPKTTSEYIQATSRVGRATVPGLVVTLYRSGKARDRSTFEAFRTFHGSFYRFVEPTSVTPWALQARRRALRAALVIVVRHAVGWASNASASSFDDKSPAVEKAIELLLTHIRLADPGEAADIEVELRSAARDWADRARLPNLSLKYESTTDPGERLLKDFGDPGIGWPTMHSMRSVERGVRIRPRGERA